MGLPIGLAFEKKIGMIANQGGMKSLVESVYQTVRTEFETCFRMK